jgi:hypothetical protein
VVSVEQDPVAHSLNLFVDLEDGLSGSARPVRGRGWEIHDGGLVTAVDLGELAAGAGQADLESFDFAVPSFAFCPGDPGEARPRRTLANTLSTTRQRTCDSTRKRNAHHPENSVMDGDWPLTPPPPEGTAPPDADPQRARRRTAWPGHGTKDGRPSHR